MTQKKRLIVNADDLGRTGGINRGVFAAHRHGIVTSATLMVNYAAAAEVKALSRENPRLGIGLHVALTGGPSTLPPERIRSLVDADGKLPAKPEGHGTLDPKETLAEAEAQLARFEELMGRLPTHFDTHHHSHRLPAVLDALVALAKRTGRPVRNFGEGMADRFRREGIRTTDHFHEDFYDQGVTTEALLALMSGLPEGTTELMCHPAEVDDELRRGSGYAEPRAQELVALTNPTVRTAMEAAGVELVTFEAL
jgi:predicted glycoside hydrolase/deacetylase ChbG (UPF0249 family)